MMELARQQKAMDKQLADCGREIENKQAEIERLGQELTRMMESLRESEAKREQERRSSDLRDREHEKTVKRLRAMVESVRKLSDAGGYVQDDTAGGYAQDNTAGDYAQGSAAGGYAQGGAAGDYAQDGAAGGYAQGGAAEDYAYDSAGEGYVPDGGTYDNGAEGYAPDTAADDYGWMGDMAEPPAGGVIRRGAVNDRSRKPFAGQGLRPDRPAYPGASAGMKNMNRSGSPTGMGGMNRAGSPAGAGVMNRAGSPAGAGGMNRSGSAPRGVTVENTPVRSSVMDDLVQMASADDGVLKEELFSVDECLENIMVLQQPVCAGKKIRLELKKSISVPEKAVGDKAKLQRALVSLLESVAEQMPTNSVINLGCRADRASGNRVFLYFTIRDNESSIANELMQGMFENKSEKDDPLRAGLYIAREIISAMGGNVRVRSRRGEGTEITVTVCMKLPQT